MYQPATQPESRHVAQPYIIFSMLGTFICHESCPKWQDRDGSEILEIPDRHRNVHRGGNIRMPTKPPASVPDDDDHHQATPKEI